MAYPLLVDKARVIFNKLKIDYDHHLYQEHLKTLLAQNLGNDGIFIRYKINGEEKLYPIFCHDHKDVWYFDCQYNSSDHFYRAKNSSFIANVMENYRIKCVGRDTVTLVSVDY